MKKLKHSSKFGGGGFDRFKAGENRRPGTEGRGRPERRDFSKPGFDRQLFQATCANCGASCEVPFKPSGSRPVYCRDCFHKQEDNGPARPAFRRNDSPRPMRPAFRRPDAVSPGRSDNMEKEFEKINQKLDRILQAMESE